jgi:hypothetical protein
MVSARRENNRDDYGEIDDEHSIDNRITMRLRLLEHLYRLGLQSTFLHYYIASLLRWPSKIALSRLHY